jgi:hypothetical protein
VTGFSNAVVPDRSKTDPLSVSSCTRISMKSNPRDGDSNSSTPSTVLRAEGRPRLVVLHNLVRTFLGFVGGECNAVTAALEADRPRTMMHYSFSPETKTASPRPSTETRRTYPDGQRELFGILSPTIAR